MLCKPITLRGTTFFYNEYFVHLLKTKEEKIYKDNLRKNRFNHAWNTSEDVHVFFDLRTILIW